MLPSSTQKSSTILPLSSLHKAFLGVAAKVSNLSTQEGGTDTPLRVQSQPSQPPHCKFKASRGCTVKPGLENNQIKTGKVALCLRAAAAPEED